LTEVKKPQYMAVPFFPTRDTAIVETDSVDYISKSISGSPKNPLDDSRLMVWSRRLSIDIFKLFTKVR